MEARVLWATQALVTSFSPKTGRWRTPTGEAWQPAIAIEAMLLAYELTLDVVHLNVVEKSFARYAHRRSRFFDDDGWYLNAWLRAYDLTGDPKYLAEARALFDTMAAAWDDRCGGGVWWNEERTYKNAITNELFLLAASRLARRVAEQAYSDWALRAWRWFDASGLINADGLVNDGLDGDCRNNGQPTWTYNQGVILSALVELWRLTGDGSHLEVARRIATAATAATGRLVHVQDGQCVLREACEPDMGNRDAHAFKGILAQGLARLCAAEPSTFDDLRTFLSKNADAVWRSARKRGFGMAWLGPPGPVNAATEASAALLLGAVDLLHDGGEAAGPPPGEGVAYEAAGWNRAGSVTFRCTVDGPGPHVATLRYAAGKGDALRCVLVDGEVQADRLLFTGTGGWDSYSTVSLRLSTTPGERSVSIRFDPAVGSRNYLNLDRLILR